MFHCIDFRPVPPGDNETEKKGGDGDNEDENDDNEDAEEEPSENDPELSEGPLFSPGVRTHGRHMLKSNETVCAR